MRRAPKFNKATVYTDGSCHNNGQAQPSAGVGVYWPEAQSNNVSASYRGRQTNNAAEISAAETAVRQAKSLGYDHVTVHTDSNQVVKAMEKNGWVDRWERNGWKTSDNREVINKEEYQQLRQATREIDTTFVKVDRSENAIADKLARRGAGI